MNSNSDSNMESALQPNQQNTAAVKQKIKHKKIRKGHRKESCKSITSVGSQIQNIIDFTRQYGDQYFSKSIVQVQNQFKSILKAKLHIKHILGLQQNVYQIKNHQNSQQTATEYLLQIENQQNLKYFKIGIRFKQSKLALYCSVAKKRKINKKQNILRILNKPQIIFWKQRKSLLKQIQIFFKTIPNINIKKSLPFLQKQIIALCKLNTLQQSQIINQISYKAKQEDSLFNIQQQQLDQQSKQISNQYIKCLIRKNLIKGFDQTPIDFLNYFKAIENTEKNLYQDIPLKKIKNLAQFKDYLNSRRPKQRRLQKSLRTCCAGCFSNYYELSNPIDTCLNCGVRMHKFCQKKRGKCQRCKFFSKIHNDKNHKKICKICQKNMEKGVLIQRIIEDQNQQYAHTFCLLVHNLWTIEDGVLKGVIKNSNRELSQCNICNKQTKHYLKCLDSQQRVHGMCAYLSGHSLQISQNNTVLVSFHHSMQEAERLSLERRYKLNYQKMIYKSGNELFNLIQTA